MINIKCQTNTINLYFCGSNNHYLWLPVPLAVILLFFFFSRTEPRVHSYWGLAWLWYPIQLGGRVPKVQLQLSYWVDLHSYMRMFLLAPGCIYSAKLNSTWKGCCKCLARPVTSSLNGPGLQPKAQNHRWLGTPVNHIRAGLDSV